MYKVGFEYSSIRQGLTDAASICLRSGLLSESDIQHQHDLGKLVQDLNKSAYRSSFVFYHD